MYLWSQEKSWFGLGEIGSGFLMLDASAEPRVCLLIGPGQLGRLGTSPEIHVAWRLHWNAGPETVFIIFINSLRGQVIIIKLTHYSCNHFNNVTLFN